MIPLRDNVKTSRAPILPWVVIGVTALVFIAQLLVGDGLIEQFGMIPERVLHPGTEIMVREYAPGATLEAPPVVQERPALPSPVPVWLTLLTCVFLHGGWMHFLGNMWFLHIFGDNVEDCFGRLGFVAFYLIAGVVASATHLFTNLGSVVPTIGASGAIAGVMGAYMVLYPKARVLTLVPLGFFIRMMELPAWIFLGIWFGLQFLQGAVSITSEQSSGVAWWAHIGGFVLGGGVAFVLTRTGIVKPPGHTLAPPESVRRSAVRRLRR